MTAMPVLPPATPVASATPGLPRHAVGREITGVLDDALRREWLVTDGTGAYACGTVAMARTRRYHGLLIAAAHPPAGRRLVVGALVEAVTVAGEACGTLHLQTQRWASGAVDPRGHELCEEMRLDGTLPVWRYALPGGVLLERRLWMPAGSGTTAVEYAVIAAPHDIRVGLRLSPLMAWRDHHGTMRAGDDPVVTAAAGAEGAGVLRVRWPDGGTARLTASAGGRVSGGGEWYLGQWLDAEAERGLEPEEDLFRAGAVEADLVAGASLTLTLAVEADARGVLSSPAPAAGRDDELRRQERLLRGAPSGDPGWVRRLTLAADAFVAGRSGGQTVLAGFPWFGDWGRDTFIALPGLALETGRLDLSASLLRTFAARAVRGMIPNRFPDSGEAPEYNTIDATLWFIEALRRHVAAGGDATLVDELWPVLEEIVRWHRFGTRHGIEVDPEDGLLRGGEPGVQLTWMDAQVGSWVVTPRIGKPVEVNALWYSALRALAGWAAEGRATRHDHAALAAQVASSFGRYWTASTGCLADVLDGPDGDDLSIRPNQLVAAALEHSPLRRDHAGAVVDVVLRRLVTSVGVRTLDPADPAYRPGYGGGVMSRDGAYHQGTAWPWLLGPLVEAHLRVHGDPDAARGLLAPLEHHLDDAGLGSISEIADGAPPHTPRGCPWQAWSVAEVLRAWRLCDRAALHSAPRPAAPTT